MGKPDELWRGNFGSEYTIRNLGHFHERWALFERALARTSGIESVLEFGANVGDNLVALRTLLPRGVKLAGLEVNEQAASRLEKVADSVYYDSMLDFSAAEQWDLTFTRGVLIHIAPDDLPKAYDALVENSRRYVLIAEYYNPEPVSIPYRGQENALWKRDFAREMMALHNLVLIDYGFCYRGDAVGDMNDVTYFLMERR